MSEHDKLIEGLSSDVLALHDELSKKEEELARLYEDLKRKDEELAEVYDAAVLRGANPGSPRKPLLRLVADALHDLLHVRSVLKAQKEKIRSILRHIVEINVGCKDVETYNKITELVKANEHWLKEDNNK